MDRKALCSLDTLLSRMYKCMNELTRQCDGFIVNFEPINETLPKFVLSYKMNKNNFISNYLATKNIGLKSFDIQMGKDSIIGLDGKLLSLTIGSTILDTITMLAWQEEKDLKYL